MFPHNTLPHFVWIGPDGTVKAITEFMAVNATNIQLMLNQKQVAAREKKDVIIPYNTSQPLFPVTGPGASLVTIHSAISGYIDGIGCGWHYTVGVKSDTSAVKRITARNFTIAQLYQLALCGGTRTFGWNRTLLEVKDTAMVTSKKIGMEFADWLKDGHGFCYELSIPSTLASHAFVYMTQDLERYFPEYRGDVESCNMTCLALVRTSLDSLPKTSGKKPEALFDGLSCKLTNCALNVLVHRLDIHYMAHLKMPVIDETGYSNHVDLEINAPLSDVDAVNLELARYHLKLVKRQHDIEMMVLKDTPKE